MCRTRHRGVRPYPGGVSDPTTPPRDHERDPEVPTADAAQLDSEPIDVKELLESTRKLFEPEELQRAMEQAGYTPEPSINAADKAEDDSEESGGAAHAETTDQVDDDPATPAIDQGPEDEPAVDPEKTTPEPDVTVDGADKFETDELVDDEPASDEPGTGEGEHEEPPLKGVNILSIVAFILALALSPLALIFGYIALGQLRRARQRGETLALWAIGLGWLVFAAWVIVVASLLWIGYQQGMTVDSLREFIDLFSLP